MKRLLTLILATLAVFAGGASQAAADAPPVTLPAWFTQETAGATAVPGGGPCEWGHVDGSWLPGLGGIEESWTLPAGINQYASHPFPQLLPHCEKDLGPGTYQGRAVSICTGMVAHLGPTGANYVMWLACIRWGYNPECGRWLGRGDPDTGWISAFHVMNSKACPGTDAYPPPVAPLTKCQAAKKRVKGLKGLLSITKGKAQRAKIEKQLKLAKLHGKRVCHRR